MPVRSRTEKLDMSLKLFGLLPIADDLEMLLAVSHR